MMVGTVLFKQYVERFQTFQKNNFNQQQPGQSS